MPPALLQSNEADAMLISNPAALRQYNDRCRQISEQERSLAALEEQRQLARQTIDNITVRFLQLVWSGVVWSGWPAGGLNARC